MKRIVRLVAAGLLLSLGAPAAVAAQADPVSFDERVYERGVATSAALNEAGDLMTEIVGDPGIAAPTTPQAMVATVEAKSARLAEVHARLVVLAGELKALPPLAGNARAVDQHVDDVADLIDKMAAIIENIQDIPAAAKTGGEAQVRAAHRITLGGGVLLQETQALSLRGAAAQMDPSSADYNILTSMACLSDGHAALQAGVVRLRPFEASMTKMGEAEACIRDNVGRGRIALQGQTGEDADIKVGYLDVMTEGADWLATVRAAALRGESSGQIAITYNPPYNAIVEKMQALTRREHALRADAL